MFELLESKRVSSPGLALHVGLVVLGAILSGEIRNPWPLIVISTLTVRHDHV